MAVFETLISVVCLVPELKGRLRTVGMISLVSCALQLAMPFLFAGALISFFHPLGGRDESRNIAVLIGCVILYALFFGVEARLALQLRHRGAMLIEQRCGEALLRKSVIQIKRREAGELASHINADVAAAADAIGFCASLSRTMALLVGSIVALIVISPFVSLLAGGMALTYGILVNTMAEKMASAYFDASNATGRCFSYLQHLILGVMDIKIAGSREFFLRSYCKRIETKAGAMTAAGIASKRIDQGTYITQMLGSLIVLMIAAGGGRESAPQITGAVAALGVLGFFWTTLRSLVTQFFNMRRSVPLLRRLLLWLSDVPLKGESDIRLGYLGDCAHADVEDAGIRLRNVSFSFNPGGEQVLADVDFIVRPGERILLTGENGVGKTTLLLMLAGVLCPNSGSVELDGLPLQNVAEAQLRRRISRISHDGYLFPESAMDNILFGRSDWIGGQEVNNAVEMSGCTEMVDGGVLAPSGVGHQGGRLSAGQRQRVLLARGLASDPDFLLLDEATSSMDAASTRYVFEKLLLDRGDLRSRAIVIAAHHADFLIPMVDRHLALVDGKLISVVPPPYE